MLKLGAYPLGEHLQLLVTKESGTFLEVQSTERPPATLLVYLRAELRSRYRVACTFGPWRQEAQGWRSACTSMLTC